MTKFSAVAAFVSLSVSAFAQDPEQAQFAELTSLNEGVATYKIVVCNEATSRVSADVDFAQVQAEYARAEIKILVAGDRGMCMGGRKTLQFDVKQLLKDKIQEKGIKSLSVLMKSLPSRLEIQNNQ